MISLEWAFLAIAVSIFSLDMSLLWMYFDFRKNMYAPFFKKFSFIERKIVKGK